ncbi:putative electron transfer flavoprotein subunit, partial [Irineochytrium annulatum]
MSTPTVNPAPSVPISAVAVAPLMPPSSTMVSPVVHIKAEEDSFKRQQLQQQQQQQVQQQKSHVCSNCGCTSTPLWRRGLNNEVICNACGLYLKARNTYRPASLKKRRTITRNIVKTGDTALNVAMQAAAAAAAASAVAMRPHPPVAVDVKPALAPYARPIPK